ncbi:hypothetical protein L2E82_03800 [Cichorium intybus]|uniref:Uncharacterized protein n=1 Tax=Cichorium intybus TaxID=13427 RepID=A0ACB9H4F5_CICIN|nr:hypothetical protein L2E82_03800 [Cichorium intybus]
MEQLFFTSKWFCFLFIFAAVAAADDELTGWLCVSECNTCPAVCSSPPNISKPPPSPAPPAVSSRPPPSPALVHHAPPPPRFYYFDSPIAVAPPLAKSPPSPGYTSVGGKKTAPPPPRFVYFPSNGGDSGQTNYPYPYYMYDSKAGSLSVRFSWVLSLLVSLHVTLLVFV